MQFRREQQQTMTARVSVANPRGNKNLHGPLTASAPRHGQFLAPARRDRSGADNVRTIGFSQVVNTLLCAAVIEERNRLAGEIHDTLTQEFAGILLYLEAAHSSHNNEPQNVSDCLARAKELAKSGLEDARRMLLGLRPKSLEGAQLSDALQQLAERFSRECGIDCTFRTCGEAPQLPEDIQNELYRVAQEALCNVRKHSRAGQVSMALSYRSGLVVLTIKDNGRGFATLQPRAGAHGFGLPTMCDRAIRLGGRIDINTGLGAGTEVRMTVPLPAKLSVERSHQ